MGARKKPTAKKKKTPRNPNLFGGINPVKAKVKKGKMLGRGAEGKVFEVEVTVKRKGKTGKRKRTISLAEKRFFAQEQIINVIEKQAPFRDPEKQFKIIQGLSKLNREKKLGLRIIPTIRLRQRWPSELMTPSLITTKLNALSKKEIKKLPPKQKEEFFEDLIRQTGIAIENGYIIKTDSFMAVKDKKTGKWQVIIADFGFIYPI